MDSAAQLAACRCQQLDKVDGDDILAGHGMAEWAAAGMRPASPAVSAQPRGRGSKRKRSAEWHQSRLPPGEEGDEPSLQQGAAVPRGAECSGSLPAASGVDAASAAAAASASPSLLCQPQSASELALLRQLLGCSARGSAVQLQLNEQDSPDRRDQRPGQTPPPQPAEELPASGAGPAGAMAPMSARQGQAAHAQGSMSGCAPDGLQPPTVAFAALLFARLSTGDHLKAHPSLTIPDSGDDLVSQQAHAALKYIHVGG